jgi:hypothetical protein
MAPHARPPLDRVSQRRRAAALARHYRDAEQLPIAEIARRLGRAPATIKAYLPTGEKARAVKARYRGYAAAAGPTRARATARATPTSTAGVAASAPPRRSGRASACASRCEAGPSSTAAPSSYQPSS